MRRVVLAPDSFKGTATAAQAATAIAEGWRSVRPADQLVLRPMADGGEGTLDAFANAVPDAQVVPVGVSGPDGARIASSWVLLPAGPGSSGSTGVVELAATSGITLLDELRPHDATTIGFGEAIAAALDAGVDRLLLAIGGSASTDGGAGLLGALGAQLIDQDGKPIAAGNRGLSQLARADLGALRELPKNGATILSDVTSPLLGPHGAAAVFGPQKGANAKDIATLEANLAQAARHLPADPEASGAGAAGGAGFGLLAWGAVMAGGAAAVARAIGLPETLIDADIVVTGEGRYDDQSPDGKVPSEVCRLAGSTNIDVALVAGEVAVVPQGFTAWASLTDLAPDSTAAMSEPLYWLRQAGAALANQIGD